MTEPPAQAWPWPWPARASRASARVEIRKAKLDFVIMRYSYFRRCDVPSPSASGSNGDSIREVDRTRRAVFRQEFAARVVADLEQLHRGDAVGFPADSGVRHR